MAGQINILKDNNHSIPPTGCRGYGFDLQGNPVMIKEDGTVEIIGVNGQSIMSVSNIIANKGIGLASELPAYDALGDIYVANDEFTVYTAIDGGWDADPLVASQFITNTFTALNTLYQYDGIQLIELISEQITGNEIVGLLEALTADDRLDASAIKNLPTEAAVGGFASNVYFSNTNSDILGYKKQSSTVDPAETVLVPTVQLSDGDKLVNQYLFDLPANINLIQQGNWSFTFASFVSSATGDTRIGFRPFRYTALGVKTYTFSAIVWSDELNQLVREYKTANIIQESKAIELTDRLGCDLYIKTSSAAAVTVNIVIGDGQALFMNVPIALRHSALRDLNGDSNYQHITQAEKNIIPLNASAFNGNLTPSDNTLQKIADKFDDLYVPVIETIDIETIEEYDPLQTYLGGNTYKSYVNLASPDPQFQNPAIYRCVYDAAIYQTPETDPYNPVTDTGIWWYLGSDPLEVSTRSTANSSVRQMSDLQGITGAKSGDTVGVRIETYNNVEIIYMFNALSTATPTQYTVIKPFDVPLATPGRWELKNVRELVIKPTVFNLPVGSDLGTVGNNSSFYLNAVNGRTSFTFSLLNGDGFNTDIWLQHQKKWFIVIDNSANSSAMSFTFTLPSLHTLEWVGSTAVTSIAAGKKARLWITSASKAIVAGAIDTRCFVKYELIGEASGGGDSIYNGQFSFSCLDSFSIPYARAITLTSVIKSASITDLRIGKNGATPVTITFPYSIAANDLITFAATYDRESQAYFTLIGTKS